MNVPTISQDELIDRIKTDLESRPQAPGYSHFDLEPAPARPGVYALILGAGFSYGVVPLTAELMNETIGGYYYPDQDQSSLERPSKVLRRDSANFWMEFNQVAARAGLPTIALDGDGLPKNPGAAYQHLFTYQAANVLFAQLESEARRARIVEGLKQRANGPAAGDVQAAGERFVKGFLQYVLNPGAEHGLGSAGRSRLNPAHIYLSALLEAQQLGRGWKTAPFCRTILTTNFDTLLQNALQMVNLLYRLTDRPERGFDHSDFNGSPGLIHLVYVHGSILRHNPASTIDELDELAGKNIAVLQKYLGSKDIIIVGYSGWNDGLMTALHLCDPAAHRIYWCDIRPEPAERVAKFIGSRSGKATYVPLGEGGAGQLMRALYETLIPAATLTDPMERYREWFDLVWKR